jgi:hypothetical protein
MARPDLSYLTRGETAPQRLAVGGLLAVLGVTWPVLLGYAVGVCRATYRGDRSPPDVEEWAPLLRDGAIATAIVVTFAFPVLLGAWLLGWPASASSPGTALVVLAIALAAAYVLPAALARFAHRDSLAAGLDVWTLLDVVLLPVYARTWIGLSVTAAVLVGGTRVLLTGLDGTGVALVVWIVATLVGYAVLVLGTHAMGTTYARIMRLEADDSGLARRSRTDGR